MSKESLKTLVLDTEKNVYMLNGKDISENTSELHLDFERGEWSLAVTQTSVYTASNQVTKKHYILGLAEPVSTL